MEQFCIQFIMLSVCAAVMMVAFHFIMYCMDSNR